MNSKIINGILLTSALACGCQQTSNKQHTTEKTDSVDTSFDSVIDSKDVKLYTLTNGKLKAALTNYGARLVNLQVPDKAGNLTDVILGYDSAAEYKANASNFYGAIVGRYGNRIGDATFTLQGVKYELEKNDGKNSLHGGTHGVYNQVWDVANSSDSSITFTYLSPDGEAGYPGEVKMQVTYTLSHTGGLVMDYQANTDKETVLNLTNHAYFNLNGAGSATILDHELQIDAAAITEVDDTLIPTGKSIQVAGTPFDFRKGFVIGDRIETDNAQLKIGKGYDHNFELSQAAGFRKVASVYAPKTGIEMQVLTTEPGLQFYSGNFMKDTDPKGKGGLAYPFRSAFCLETQHYPDAPNHPAFASTVLKPEQTYSTKSEYRFTIK
ncbi:MULTISPECIES: aldose epimerase family protein [Sphingobacterium]|uniref:aldose epimerase family protein n=1 Tax=Sphingobacterium TaxID=28453 RepID=UPI00038A540F|nr:MULTISPECIES: aldose epimerase family protein [Sphingobacterium]KKX49924.1 aldose 1-epimerase [Sphingobacterium sp. IITKGP-BTPF85]MCW2263835.1 aldose 1-epimerase [Sphingobacterium kitahiroshimense]NJI73426.1 galactose mutarotase [Sphingobacterium sp. B16(2022)]TCR00367.1 aldose 1-epimerase [Sphingobacterium sp. JUb78]